MLGKSVQVLLVLASTCGVLGNPGQNRSRAVRSGLGATAGRRRSSFSPGRNSVFDEMRLHEKKSVHGDWCVMDSYDAGSSHWGDESNYYYKDILECGDLCDAQASCAGFVDHLEHSSPYCLFKTSTTTYARDSDDFYEKYAPNYMWHTQHFGKGDLCTMGSYRPKDSRWQSHSKYQYDDPSECADLCDGESKCAAYTDHITESPVFCAFLETAEMESDDDYDVYVKVGGGGGGGGGTCAGGWPQFSSQTELASDGWGTYFTHVYGTLPAFTYPLCIGEFLHFYDDLITSSNAIAPSTKNNCPSFSQEGERYVQNNLYQPQRVSYSWHSPPYAAIAANTWLEVSHQADPFGDEHYGMWFLWAKGNGIWFNTGSTVVFGTHQQAFDAWGTGVDNEAMSREASKRGYDSVQFISHHDDVNYPCAVGTAVSYMNLEIVATNLRGTYACGAPGGAPSSIRGGWEGSQACNCVESVGFLNCGISTSSASSVVAV